MGHAEGVPHISRWQSGRPEAYSVATGQPPDGGVATDQCPAIRRCTACGASSMTE
jgi:hypothetical protein